MTEYEHTETTIKIGKNVRTLRANEQLRSFQFTPEVYVLPGQKFEVIMQYYECTEQIKSFVKEFKL